MNFGSSSFGRSGGRLLAGACLVLWFPLLGWAGFKTYHFKQLSAEQGLSHNAVLAVLQDHKGFIWIGTEDGLNKYDGRTFKIFKPGLTPNLEGRSISCLTLDSSGLIWVGTWGGGLSVLDPRTETFEIHRADPKDPNALCDNRVQTLYEDRAGNIWVGAFQGGLNRYDPVEKRFHHYHHDPENPHSLAANRIWALTETGSGKILIGTSRGLSMLDVDSGLVTNFEADPNLPDGLSENLIRSMMLDSRDRVWIGSENGLFRFDEEDGTFTRMNLGSINPTLYSNTRILAMLEESPDRLWIGTIDSLNILEPSSGRVLRQFVNDPKNPNGLSHNDIRDLAHDRSGMLWVATRGGGLNKLDLKPKKFQHIKQNLFAGGSLNSNKITTIYEDRAGALWVGTNGGGLNYLERDDEQMRFKHYIKSAEPGSLSGNHVGAVTQDGDGVLWVGTWWDGLNRFDAATQRFTTFRHGDEQPGSLSDNRVTSLLSGRDGLWVGTTSGLNRFRPDTGTFDVFRPKEGQHDLSDSIILCMMEDRNGVLWLGTDFGGLNRYDAETGWFLGYLHDPADSGSLSSDRVWSLLEDRSGRIWVGTEDGLNRLDRHTGRFSHYRAGVGLPNGVIKGILEDQAGFLWVSTNQGLSRFDPRRETFVNFKIYDGLQGRVFNANAAANTQGGLLYFGGNNGLNRFDPANMEIFNYHPPVVFTAIRTSARPILVDTPFSEVASLTFNHLDKFLSFEFTALDYSDRESRFAYMLEGFDNKWNQAGTRNLATYTNLDGGEYLLRVKTTNHEGTWSTHQATLQLNVLPPPWQTWWAYLVYLVLILGALALLLRIKNKAFQAEMARKQYELDREQELAERLEGMNRDLAQQVTERRRAESVQAALYGISELTAATDNMDRFYLELMRVVGSLVSVEHFHLALYDMNTHMLQFPVWSNPDLPKPKPRYESRDLEEHTITQGKPLLLSGSEIDTLVSNGAIVARQISPTSWLGLPLISGNHVFGIMVLQSYRDEQPYSDADRDLLSFVARQLTTVLARFRLTETNDSARAIALANERAQGKVEFADSVLHNIGNILAGMNVSNERLGMLMRRSKLGSFNKALDMLEDNKEDLGRYLLEDQRGRLLPEFLVTAGRTFTKDRKDLQEELDVLSDRLTMIRTLVQNQQNMAKGLDVRQQTDLVGLVDKALELQNESLGRYGVRVTRQMAESLPLETNSTKVLHILINLIKNGVEALAATSVEDRELHIEGLVEDGVTLLRVRDAGMGISPENLASIFDHGFTTKEEGHGFGLPFCKKSMRQLGGDLTVESEGPGMGAVFTMRFDD